MDASLKIDFPALERLVAWHLQAGTSGLVLSGTTGESAALSHEERQDLWRTVTRWVAGRIPVMAGTGSPSFEEAKALSQAAEQSGVDACLVVTPAYVKPTQEGLEAYFIGVAESMGLPVVLYNVPGRTSCDLQPETVARLSQHPRILGLKEAVADCNRMRRLRELCPDSFALLSGDDATALDFMEMGASGVISVTANVAPEAMVSMCALAWRGDFPSARVIDARLSLLHERLFLEANPIPVKWALSRMGRAAPFVRLPLTPLSARYHAPIEEALERAQAPLQEVSLL